MDLILVATSQLGNQGSWGGRQGLCLLSSSYLNCLGGEDRSAARCSGGCHEGRRRRLHLFTESLLSTKLDAVLIALGYVRNETKIPARGASVLPEGDRYSTEGLVS